MMRFQPAEKPGFHLFTRHQRKGSILNGDQGLLMLQAGTRQPLGQPIRQAMLPRRKPQKLQGIGRETGGLAQGTH